MDLYNQLTKETFPSLLKNKKFILLLSSSLLSGFSVSIYLLFEQLYVLQQLRLNASLLGIAMIATTTPRVLFMAVGGVIADRFSRSVIMFLSLSFRCLLVFAMLLLLLNGQLQIWYLIAIAFCFGSLDAFFWPARDSLVPLLVNKNQITRANSFMQTVSQLSLLAGPIVGGVILTRLGFNGALTCILLILLLGSCLLYLIKAPAKQVTRSSTFLKDLHEGFVYVIQSPLLFSMTSLFVTVNFFFLGPLMIGIPIIASHVLKGTAFEFSVLQSALGAGMLLGALVTSYMNLRKKRGLITLCLLLLEGALLVLMSQLTIFFYLILVLVILGMCISTINIYSFSLIQENTEQSKLGRVISLSTTVSIGLIPIGYGAVSGALSLHIPIDQIQLVSGTILMAICMFMILKSKAIRSAN
ncbi:MFS transporter [Paenactinomyces guangxiensis]|uniref:MFS transporter n=1 Tax=Paenactinomyces guangxiensis TaxID=1490290 RepID=A0A7W2A9F1_9BACL|nr:MFS transporter [Paenactinomyces guangxiensis]MBA4495184.1 MFS transporter [Paenactinomyces guangxiensis]MBH8592132.1 MFS transporter [Paenactinomyces guangxiensis]